MQRKQKGEHLIKKKKKDDFMALKSDNVLVSVIDTTPVECRNKKLLSSHDSNHV